MASSKNKQKDPSLNLGASEPSAGEAKGGGGGSQVVTKVELRDPSTPPLKRSPNSTFVPPSPANSAKTSREPSPIRPPLKPGTTRGQRSRKNSREGSPNPSAGSSTQPSVSAVQRALVTANTPSLVPTVVSEPVLKAPRPQRPAGGMPPDSALRWPTSPRLRSPPPKEPSGRSALLSPRKLSLEQSTLPPSIVFQGPSPAPRSGSTTPTPQSKADAGADPEDQTPPSGIRTPARGVSGSASTLETVQESSLPATPAIGGKLGILSDDERPEKITEHPLEEIVSKSIKHHIPESGSESGGNKSDGKGARVSGFTTGGIGSARPGAVPPTKSYSALNPRGKPAGEGSTKNMTVETETVSSIPQVAVGGGAGERGGPTRSETGGSVRQKPSTETIRPKKEKKRVRKAPSVTAGTGGFSSHLHRHHHHHRHRHYRSASLISSSSATSTSTYGLSHAVSDGNSPDHLHSPKPFSYNFRSRLTGQRIASSKADIFEAKIASAVDEADSSDSEEAFVYESNPPESHPPRSSRYHSRTPSVTSMHSQADQRSGLRSVHLDGNQSKRSMKFTNNPYNNSAVDGDTFSSGGADGSGTVRAGGIGSGRGNGGNGAHHHHIGHSSRNGRGGHTSIFAEESPFPNATKPSKLGGPNGSKSASRPNSPRNSHLRPLGMNGNGTKKPKMFSYDMDPDGADDERTPLISSVRVNRNHQNRRRFTGSLRQLEHNQLRQRQGLIGRLAGCILFTVMLILVISGALGFLFATTKPLLDVSVLEIKNVLASEQEIMLDLVVKAVNPNVISVTISDMDVNLFAKSNFLGKKPRNASDIFSRSDWERRKRKRRRQASDYGDATALPTNKNPGYHAEDDPISDPIQEPGEGDPQTMLLGRIFEFDSALTFEGSPVQRQSSSSVGEVRLAKPGNKTEAGGSARWERVIQHPFELIVRGVLKYQLPLSTRVRTAPIGMSVVVHPEDGIDEKGRMTVHQVSQPYPPGSNVVVVGGATLDNGEPVTPG
ncbi:hypothetical protein FGG08_005286 [Glutinoglossum americanum]|uniref:Phospholipid metabolism enzyme regulator n=1 Tax=Glutinoglossum americanum TaxID=1670608 RepID=A0A9P8L320_9PEZI|nr:hypothetical protein FGG08_005286 [Glutinoglossum americanum]